MVREEAQNCSLTKIYKLSYQTIIMAKEEVAGIDFAKELDKLKKEYKPLQKKYSLPEFERLQEDFDVDRAVYRETSFILRDLRRIIAERLSSYHSLFEMLVNPAGPPVFFYLVIKNLKPDELKEIKKIYDILSKIQIRMIKTDIVYEEKAEAEMIKSCHEQWQDIKPKIKELIESFEKKLENVSEDDKRGYLG
jgi:protein subunit release factor A